MNLKARISAVVWALFGAAAAAAALWPKQAALACHQGRFNAQQPDNLATLCGGPQPAPAAAAGPLADLSWPTDDDLYLRLLSSKRGARLERSLERVELLASHLDARQEPARPAGQPAPQSAAQLHYVLEVRAGERRQQVLGYGGAFSDSAAQMMLALNGSWSAPPGPDQAASLRHRLLADYFGPDGLDYNLARVPVGGSDMSQRAYSYDDLPANASADLALAHFRLQPEDLELKLPAIAAANSLRARRQLGPLKLIAASWSPPAWMKTNANLVQGSLKAHPRNLYYDAYARYLCKFLDEYERFGNLTFWALSPQNEPYTPKRYGPQVINFNSAHFTPAEMATFMGQSLIPALLKAGRLAPTGSANNNNNNNNNRRIRLLVWDDNTANYSHYQKRLFEQPNVRAHLDGVATHWYSMVNDRKPYADLYELRKRLPERYFTLATEASFTKGPKLGDWSRAETYARDIIHHLQAGSVAWLDWNLALNTTGGPTWVNNLLDAAILVDPERQLYYRNPIYYALAHLTRFVKARSRVLAAELRQAPSNQPVAWQDAQDVLAVAAELDEPLKIERGPNGPLAIKRALSVVVANTADSSRRLELKLRNCLAKSDKKPLVLELEPHSIVSLAFVC